MSVAVADAANGPAGTAGRTSDPRLERLNRLDERLRERPDDVRLLTDKVDLLVELGRLADAQRTCSAALEKAGRKAPPMLLGLAARIALLLGKGDEAMKIARSGLAVAPSWPEFHGVIGMVLRNKGRDGEAARALERAVNLNPFRRSYRIALGHALEQIGDVGRAERVFRHLLTADPEDGDAALNLANLLQGRGVHDEAETHYRTALRRLGHRSHIYANLGALDRKRRRYEAAHLSYRKALVLRPSDGGALYNLGNLLRAEERLDEACAVYRRALCERPTVGDIHWNLSLALLAAGDLRNGFREYEWRWKYKGFPSKRRNFKQPQWDGGPLDGRTLLVHTEQGVGDVLQFLRFLPAILERKAVAGHKPGRVIFELHDTLLSLVGALPGVDRTVERLSRLPKFDVHLPLLSAPLALGVDRLQDLPREVPYLRIAEGPDVPIPEARDDLLKIGFVWGGNPQFPQDADRSTVIEHYLPLFDMPGTQWFCLQKGDREPEVARAPVSVVRVNERVKDFRDTAVIMTKLDLVVSTCTSVAHLAGALGVPTIVLLSRTPDWRWLTGRRDSPWYPTARLIRQRAHGDWPGVFAELRSVLEERIAARRSGDPVASGRR